MSDQHPIMALLLEHNSFVGQAPEMEDEIQPTDRQLNFGPGGFALLAMANTPLEQDFSVLHAVDPEQHAETWPDWEERMLGTGSGWNSHVLCEHFSRLDPEISLGWFSRVKLMPITQDQHTECLGWMRNGFPEELPGWAEEVYIEYTNALAERAPGRVPTVVSCPHCGSTDVALIVRRRLEYTGKAGVITVNGKEHFVPITQVEESSTHVAILECADCRAPADLENDEWELPGISN